MIFKILSIFLQKIYYPLRSKFNGRLFDFGDKSHLRRGDN